MKGLRPLHASQIFNNRFVGHLTPLAGGFYMGRKTVLLTGSFFKHTDTIP